MVGPLALDRTPITVVVMLAGPSVADLQQAAARRLDRAEKTAIKAQRVAEQAAPLADIAAAGGTVIGAFQSALNGIKVRIGRGQLAALRRIPGVVAVKRVVTYAPDNAVSVPRIRAPLAWDGVAGVHGEGVKVAIVDSGIDYTHADLGGPGTAAAFAAAAGTSTQPADPALFGPGASKVKGGIDLVGDRYDADGIGDALTPVPDPNPLDCSGHGTHVAGTLGGYGVLQGGAAFRGRYDALTHADHAFTIGPGVAPLADLYAVRVFGCSGSTDVVAEALEWAVDNDMDVVNLSLGTAFGAPDSAEAVAADAAVRAGVVVVASAGNDGDLRYIVSSPAVSTRAIAVAATATPEFLPTAQLALPPVDGDPARTIVALDANAAPLPAGEALTALVLRTGSEISLGCDPAEFAAQGAAGKLVIVLRDVCSRATKAINGQRAGAAAVLMIDSAAELPPFDGPITTDPITGQPVDVTIPFLGVSGPVTADGSDGFALALRDGARIAISGGPPLRTGTASFSSGGPRRDDAALKPDIAAPGEAIFSALSGSGAEGVTRSGTSAATPLVAGTAALVVQAHPGWRPAAIKAAVLNSGNPDQLADYAARRAGSGVVDTAAATRTRAYAYADRDATSLNFGLAEFRRDFVERRAIHVHNDGATAVAFDVAVIRPQGSPHRVTLGARQLTVPAHGDRSIDVTIEVPAATAGNSDDFRDAAGLVSFTPKTAAGNRGISLRVPYYVVPRVSSHVSTSLPVLDRAAFSAIATVANLGSAVPGTAGFYAWGLASPDDRLGRVDLRAAGAQAFDSADGRVIVFAINTYAAWSTPETQEFDVPIDTDGDGAPDFDVSSVDIGSLFFGAPSGQIVAAIRDAASGTVHSDFSAVAPTDASTILLPVLASSLGLTPANPRLSYTARVFDTAGADSDAFTAWAGFDAFASAIAGPVLITVPPDARVQVPISVDPSEQRRTPARGLMIVTLDNRNGADEAQLVPLTHQASGADRVR